MRRTELPLTREERQAVLINSLSVAALLLITLFTVGNHPELLGPAQMAGTVICGLGMQRSFEAAASLPGQRARPLAFRAMGGMLAAAALFTAASTLGVIDGFRP